jgi:hypothetical protein
MKHASNTIAKISDNNRLRLNNGNMNQTMGKEIRFAITI